ncbi:MAG: bifunctional 23S rRNA (guanine(2069)-N(7))-methyltransferase RlmK/23S rRNA (guanine(2445)-N(2))-methyltransferase RlmL [Deltaproteobacteria bacterium]|nr:bifunctional 23S rRNA (guanine(2069)-N(7))-methyltransferase RlmK/23S rRNA (guanine(2445)-N(2))-methyltransferase RlmL [Deltaproteobacteria bacterium]
MAPAHFFATTARGLTATLAAELRGCGATDVEEAPAGVKFDGPLEVAYRACLWSRTASRILLPLATFHAGTPTELYEGARAVRWRDHLAATGTLAVECTTTRASITHTHFAALKVKDAVVDQLRDLTGTRPSVDLRAPDLRIDLHLAGDEAVLSLDLSGGGLHRRGYRAEAGPAPLRENLAAAILLLAHWPEIASQGGALCDPMCGSGTFVIEAALAAADVAPGLLRGDTGPVGWRQHDRSAWARVFEEARGRDCRERGGLAPMVGSDVDPDVVRMATANAGRAGVAKLVRLERRELSSCEPPPGATPGVVVANPPYGERLPGGEPLRQLYRRLGDTLKQRFGGYTAWILCGDAGFGKQVGLKPARRHVVYNGPIECRLLEIPVTALPARAPARTDAARAAARPGAPAPTAIAPAAEAFANRLRKNLRSLRRWAEREGVTCYRVYDADLPEHALAVDLYERWVHVQEYEPPPTVDPRRAEARLHDALAAIPAVLEVPPGDVFLKVRRRQRGFAQYEKLARSEDFREVHEGGHTFLVNLVDYLDTGLFLDHRPTRALLRDLARGRRFLNLFGYTGTATVYAAGGGAASSTTVDLSQTHLAWARRNFALNGLRAAQHETVRADVLEWLGDSRRRFGLIFLDPPTFSNSKGMRTTLDVQRDHVALLRAAGRLLEPDGVLIFSTNSRRFKLEGAALPELLVEDVTRATIPRDFARRPRVHQAWRIQRRR